MRECLPRPPPNVSHVTCHVSRVTCYVSHVTCHMSRVTCHNFFFFFWAEGWGLSGGGLLLTGPTPSSFPLKQRLHKSQILPTLSFQKPYWDQARLSSLVNKQVDITVQYSVHGVVCKARIVKAWRRQGGAFG